MKQLLFVAFCCALVVGTAAAEDETVPTTVEGGAHTMKEGGRNIGEGFKGIGRGFRDVFTGESSKGNFKEGKKVGTGILDLGRGIGGLGRGFGRDIKNGFEAQEGPPPANEHEIREEKLDQ